MDTGGRNFGNDWISENSSRTYPVVEWADPRLSDGSPLPRGLLADAMVVVAKDPAPVEVAAVCFGTRAVSVELSCSGESLGSASCPYGSRAGEPVEIGSSSGKCSGWIAFGSFVASGGWSDPGVRGVHRLSGCALESRCVAFSGEPPVNSFSGTDGDGGPVSGDVVLALSENLEWSPERNSETGEFLVGVGLSDPASMLPDCLPAAYDPSCLCPLAVTTVAGVGADGDGNVRIVLVSPPGGPVASVWTHPSTSSISLMAAIPRKALCARTPAVPDQFGRLGPSHSSDCPPSRNYGLDFSGPDCDNPPPSIPAPEPEP